MVSPFLGWQYPRGNGRLEGQDPKVLRRGLSRQRGEEERRSLELRTSKVVFSLLSSTLQGLKDARRARAAPTGRRLAVFFAKTYARIVTPSLVEHPVRSSTPDGTMPPRVTPWQGWQGSVFARVLSRSFAWTETSAKRGFERTDANGSEQSLAFAMQKVEGSSPFIRFKKNPLRRVFVAKLECVSPRCGP
jgi:hypothetical protein